MPVRLLNPVQAVPLAMGEPTSDAVVSLRMTDGSETRFPTAGRHLFPVEHRWSLAELAGYVRSTSLLPPSGPR